MALDHHARAGAPISSPGAPSQAEYDAIHDTMMGSARGRWFLGEYARRNRSADTTAVLTAIDRIGAHLRGEALPPSAPEYLQLGLMAMAGLVAAVEADMAALSTGHETQDGAKPRVGRVVSTLRDLGDCIQVMLDGFKTPTSGTPATPSPPAPPPPAAAPLALVETPPVTAAPAEIGAVIAVTDNAVANDVVAITDYESDFVPFEFNSRDDDAPDEAAMPPMVTPLGPGPAPQTHPADHPLAELRSLSRAELIALFT